MGAAIALRNVVERQALLDRELRLIFRHMPGAVWAVDHDLRITYATGRLLNVMGWDHQKLVGATVYDFIEDRDPKNPVVVAHLAALAGHKQSL